MKERAAQRRKILLANQSAAEIEARQIRQEISEIYDIGDHRPGAVFRSRQARAIHRR